MDISVIIITALIMYICGIIVGRNWDKYVNE